MGDTLKRIIADGYLGDLTSLDLDALRDRRTECQATETGLSYLRRLVQGRLDVLGAELQRRDLGTDGAASDLDSLVASLAGALSANTRAPGSGRLPSELGMGAVDEDLEAELDAIVSIGELAEPGAFSDDDLVEIQERCRAFEREVSGLRRRLFDRLDEIEAELTRRYRSGEANVDNLLG